MTLQDLDPRWFTADGSPDLVGVTFNCPCCVAKGAEQPLRFGVLFVEEIDRDGLPNDTHWTRPGIKWARTGDDFATLTLSPSVDASGFGHWHGFIQNGQVT